MRPTSLLRLADLACQARCHPGRSLRPPPLWHARRGRAQHWAGRPQIDEYGDFRYTARVSWVETSLALEVAVAAASFFNSVCALPGVRVQQLRAEEKSYMHKYAALQQEFQKAKFDPQPTDALLVSLLRRFPSDVCREIVEFVL